MADKRPWEVGTELATAVAGGIAYVYLAGGAITWARLTAVELPASTVVSSLPRELLVTTGFTSMVAPVTFFALGVGALAWDAQREPNGDGQSIVPEQRAKAASDEGGDDDHRNKAVRANVAKRNALRANLAGAIYVIAVSALLAVDTIPSDGPSLEWAKGALVLGALSVCLFIIWALWLNGRLIPVPCNLRSWAPAWLGLLARNLPGAAIAALAGVYLTDAVVVKALIVAVLVALPFASLWVVDGTGIGVLWRALAVAGLLALVLRIGAELDPPSVFAPAVAYTTDSRACPA